MILRIMVALALLSGCDDKKHKEKPSTEDQIGDLYRIINHLERQVDTLEDRLSDTRSFIDNQPEALDLINQYKKAGGKDEYMYSLYSDGICTWVEGEGRNCYSFDKFEAKVLLPLYQKSNK